MKKLTLAAALFALAGCNANLPQGKCGDGYREHMSGKCVKAGMAADTDFINGVLVVGAVAGAVSTGVVAP